MRAAFQQLLPEVELLSWHTHRCVITRTHHGYPYLDVVAPSKIYAVVGGNGTAAQAADAIGQTGAGLALPDQWPEAGLDPATFRLHYTGVPLEEVTE